MISEVFIEFCNAFNARIETGQGIHEWTGIYFPQGCGSCRMSEDNLISISEEMYREFLQPYNEMIFREVGGGLIHWCGDGWSNYKSVLSTQALTGVHNSSMGDFELILRQIGELDRVNTEGRCGIVYFNSMKLPCSSARVPELLARQKEYRGVLNFVFFPLDGYGLDFDGGQSGGYRRMEEEPTSVIRAFTGAA
jgi:hypothetical protein